MAAMEGGGDDARGRRRPPRGREAVPWASVVLAKPHQRRTVTLPCGDTGASRLLGRRRLVVHVRELSMVRGGLGCALWDGSIVLARWLARNPQVVAGQTVVELGAGCGLPGLVAARVARQVVLTEYIPELVANLQYNIALNSRDEPPAPDAEATEAEAEADFADSDDEGPVASPAALPFNYDLKSVASATFLDWLQVPDPRAPKPAAREAAPAPPAAVCTRTVHGNSYRVQRWRTCTDCYRGKPDDGVCEACAAVCHAGHALGPVQESRFRCDCADGPTACRTAEATPAAAGEAIPQADVLLGAEITYNGLSITALANVVETFLKPDGVFYETLSDDRDCVEDFVAEMQRRGFEVTRCAADASLLGNYRTHEWTHQNVERYSFYTFRRPAAAPAHPVMGSLGPQ